MLANVKIEQDKENSMCHRVYINRNEVQCICHMDFSIDACEAPLVCIEAYGIPDFEGMADVSIKCMPTIEDACKILRNELLKHGDLYNGFVASVLGVIKPKARYIGDGETEILVEFGENYLAEEIVKRIIGEE